MNGTRAKKIRREVYGENSIRDAVQYVRAKSGQIIAVGLRGEYKGKKKERKK